MRRRRQKLAALCLAASAAIGSTLLCPGAAAIGAEPDAKSNAFLLPPVLGDASLGLDADQYLVPAERKFVRLSKTLISLPDDESDDEVDDTDADQDQRRSRLRRLRIDLDEEREAESSRDQEDGERDRDAEDTDDGMSASLTSQRISQDESGRFKLPALAAPSTSTVKIGN
jgi:hypothetical protein